MVDFHSHILPQMDDGSRSVEMSLDMLAREAEQGVSLVVATPHFYPLEEDPEQFLSRRTEAERCLRDALGAKAGLPQVVVGAEVAYFRGMSDCDALRSLQIGDTAALLVELPRAPWPEQVYRELLGIVTKQNLTPIVAHVERYLPSFRCRVFLDRLLELPILLQANAGFFIDRKTGRKALNLLREGKLHLLGSDCHDLTERTPNIGAAEALIGRYLGEKALRNIRYSEQMVLQTNV